MKILQYILGFAASIAAVIVLLISAFEIATYADFKWYEAEYEKYQVLNDLEMEMEDVMEVTKEMMAYLRGNREDLVVDTLVGGEEREFFNDREKAHMVDVQNLFIGGLWIRRIAVVILAVVVGILVGIKANWKKILPKSFLISLSVLIGIVAGGGVLVMSDFNKHFTQFHHIFFDNDLWLLDPETDLLIRMLPEGFFLDMVVRIGVIFLLMMATVVIISIISIYNQRNKNN